MEGLSALHGLGVVQRMILAEAFHDGGVLVGLVALVLLFGFYVWRWTQVGRDPDAGPIFPHYEPPQGFSPSELRMLRRMGNDNLCFTADVVDIAEGSGVEIVGTTGVGAATGKITALIGYDWPGQ